MAMTRTHLASGEIAEESASQGHEYEYPLVFDIKGILKRLQPPLSPRFCIYMVPKSLRTMNDAAYTPQVVSIGPFHHGGKTIEKMEEHKLRYLKTFLERDGNRASLEHLVSSIKMWELDIRSCYAETFDQLRSDEFVKMILVDAGFVFELFLRNAFSDLWDPSDPILHKSWLQAEIRQDLMLLENQLPFFVLVRLYDSAFPSRPTNFPSFIQLTCNYFAYYNQQKISIEQDEVQHFTDLLRSFQLPLSHKPDNSVECKQNDKSIQHNVKHFTDLLRSFLPHCCRRKISAQAKSQQISRIHHLFSATELHDAGVKFKESPSKCLLDIEFTDDGELRIPCLELYDNTETFIRNLMALERCHYLHETYICEYVNLMDYLINTAKDVDLLVEKKIIVNMLGDRVPVATLFNNLCTHIVLSNDRLYIRQCKNLNAFHESRCHRWKAILRHEYFSTPWRITSTTAAIILLVLTLTQTICAIISL